MIRIFIINSDVDFLEILKIALEIREYDVFYCVDLDIAPIIIEEFKPHIIIVDVQQKSFLNLVNDNPAFNKLPTILLSGRNFAPDRKDVQADEVVEKPFELELLDIKIKKLVSESVY